MFRWPEDVERRRTRLTEARPLRRLLVTEVLGFVGSNHTNHPGRTPSGVHARNPDKVDRCGNFRLIGGSEDPYYRSFFGNATNAYLATRAPRHHEIAAIIKFSAQGHAESGLDDSLFLTHGDVLGTRFLLDLARTRGGMEEFIHVSTDEAYGEVTGSKEEEAIFFPLLNKPKARTSALPSGDVEEGPGRAPHRRARNTHTQAPLTRPGQLQTRNRQASKPCGPWPRKWSEERRASSLREGVVGAKPSHSEAKPRQDFCEARPLTSPVCEPSFGLGACRAGQRSSFRIVPSRSSGWLVFAMST
ncbi:hypothetical protein ECC02_004047 [Trypanosoma cruzi]|uniref:NAD(P)-binding domain-containing protein n=1 Tax=Trypanosoma cruzi TaxID=5693 RepID=A0A7J6Y8F4_TRYCR|nr:hypothetical protein ECC02_004047 [Trypanosoma cruzi]